MHYKCVVLVIAHDDPVMKPFKNIWVDNWNSHKDILTDCACFYLYNSETLITRKQVGNDLYFPFKETYPSPGLLQKTFGAIDFLHENGITYDMIYRTNLSSLIDWRGFVQHVDEHKYETEYYAGKYYGDKFLEGSSMFFSKDLIWTLRYNINSMDFSLPDDHSINVWFHNNKPKLQFRYIESCYDPNIMVDALNRGVFHFKFSSHPRDPLRVKDHNDMLKMYGVLSGNQTIMSIPIIIIILSSVVLLFLVLNIHRL